MKQLCLLLLTPATLSASAQSQVAREADSGNAVPTIEGYWQDVARRVLFMRGAPASSVYGKWVSLDQEQTYPSAKQIRKSGTAYELVDLLYDKNYAIKVMSANEHRIEFVRSPNGGACEMRHTCRLEGAELSCSVEHICREAGREVLDWRGEERYVRRAHCERVGRTEAQGIPVRCH